MSVTVGRATVHHGDCLEVLPGLEAESVDACICDPPYEIGFMSRAWDKSGVAFDPATWARVYRVLKPGAHLVAFGGTRTYHRLACAVEDAGFEVRDAIMWHYAAGFPKNHRVNRDPRFCQCVATAHSDECIDREPLPDARTCTVAAAADGAPPRGGAVHLKDTGQDYPAGCLPGRGSNDAQLHLYAVADRASLPSQQYVPERSRSYVSDGVPAPGSSDSPSPAQCMSRPASKDLPSQPAMNGEQRGTRPGRTLPADKSGTAGRTLGTSDSSASDDYASGFPRCQTCGKPNADGFGTSLKPATEIIVLARKPLRERTVAAQVLATGTGALNVDACRIEAGAGDYDHPGNTAESASDTPLVYGWAQGRYKQSPPSTAGRWPANLAHDGSPEVLAAFAAFGERPGFNGGGRREGLDRNGGVFKNLSNGGSVNYFSDTGTAARFFFSAKADTDDRAGSSHPTIKPLALMEWLVRLVCPPGGVCLDPFAGTGVTGEACLRQGFNAVLIEREAEYHRDILYRMGRLSGADAPLFSWEAA